MAGSARVSDFTAMGASALVASDLLPVVDVSASAERKLTISQLRAFLQENAGHPRVKSCGSAHSNATTTPTKVTDLDLTLEAGAYNFDYRCFVRAATGGVAPKFNLNFSGTNTKMAWWFKYADLSSTLLAAIGTAAHDVTTPNLGFAMAQAENVKATTAAANMGPDGGLQATATDTLIEITGLILVTVSGDLQLYHSSETATATTVEQGSSLIAHRTA